MRAVSSVLRSGCIGMKVGCAGRLFRCFHWPEQVLMMRGQVPSISNPVVM
uniref:Uncharacterized protein n=1 Tax=Picea sitchensis TaxID=3332 RepID=A0A6B9XSH9_PICSI|nr:hypothetical protein Q903MT_gene6962 [Picea sitchensis]